MDVKGKYPSADGNLISTVLKQVESLSSRVLRYPNVAILSHSINQSINQSYTALSPMLEVAGIIF